MAAGRQEIDLVVNAITKGFDKLTNDLKDVDRATEQSGQSAKAGGLRFTEMASALSLAQQGFQVVAQAAEFAYKNISEGAQLELARNQFDNLAASIGTTSDSLLNKMGQATNGMMSNAEMIASASQLISLGLASNEEETVRLSKAVSTLGLDMQQVILTFANNSTARLDALGLSIEDVTTKAAELEKQGFTGDAFDEAVLIALEEKMTLLGDASETTAGQLQKLEADWANLTDSMKQGAAQAVGPIVSDFVKMRDGADIVADALEKGLITQMEAFRIQSRLAAGGNKDLTEELARYNIALDENNQITDHATARAAEMSDFYRQQAQDLAEQTAMMEMAQAQAESYDVALLQLVDTYQGVHEVGNVFADVLDNISGKMSEATEKGNEHEAALLRQEQAMLRMETGAGIVASGFALIRGAADSVTAAVARSSLEMEKLLGHMNSLDGRNVSASVTVRTNTDVGSLDLGGGSGKGDDSSGAKSGAGGAASNSGSTIVQNNTFNNATDPNAVATATAEKIGGLR